MKLHVVELAGFPAVGLDLHRDVVAGFDGHTGNGLALPAIGVG
jgi:hypothetical protein